MKWSTNSMLLVDDDARNLLTLAAVLDPLGYRLIRASDGLSALSLFESEATDIVLCDLMMPGRAALPGEDGVSQTTKGSAGPLDRQGRWVRGPGVDVSARRGCARHSCPHLVSTATGATR
jgi:CheY-like chemotaxis protein